MHYETKKLLAPPFNRMSKLFITLLALSIVVGCGKKPSDEKASQSIVRVNGDEITVLQLNTELQRANIQPAKQEETTKQIVSALVDRQILMQEAHKQRLDRSPRVMQAIENAKTQIIAQAYLEEKAAAVAKPTDAEVADYLSKHTDIFANRKVFMMEEIAFKVDAENVQGVQSLSDSAKTLDDVTHWLDAHQIKYARNRASHAAETVPPQLLEKLAMMVTGDLIFINSNGGTVAARMLEVKDAAISEKDAKPFIERIIVDKKHKQIAEDEVKRLRSASKIEYINKKFEPTAVNASAQPEVSIKPAEAKKPVEVVKPASNGKVESHIEKGLSGL